MSTSLYDFDTRSAPFQALAPFTPVAPFALLAWFAWPAQWWMDVYLNTFGMLSESILGAMAFPYEVPAAGDASHLEQRRAGAAKAAGVR